MTRPIWSLALLLVACVVLAAPAPEPFKSGWSNPANPDKDCKIQRGGSVLAIEMPGTDHDYDPQRKRLNAPRILREIDGEFDLQVRIRIECPPSARSTVEGQPPCVSAGFLMIFPDNYPYRSVCNRLDYGVVQQRIGTGDYPVAPLLPHPQIEKQTRKGIGEDGCVLWKDWGFGVKVSGRNNATLDRQQLKQLRPILFDQGWRNWPMPKKTDRVYLRLEQRDKWITCFISPDGEKWTKLMAHAPLLPAKSKVGLAAYSTSTEPAKVRFDQLRFTRFKKKER